MLCGRGRQADAGVCACLGIVDQGFDAKTELEILRNKAQELQWAYEYNRINESTGSRDIAMDPVPGVNSHPTAIYTADPLGNTDVAAGETNPGTQNHVVYIVDTLGNVTTATGPSSSVAANTPKSVDNAAASLSQPSNDTLDAAGPSSSSVTKIGVKTQNTPETEGQDEVGQMSKNKKKRESKKRAKARAKEAAANVEDTDTPKIQDNAAASLSTPSNDTPNAASPSSSTVAKIGVKTQDTPETEGQDEVGQMSKTQKKRENRKRAKARAKDGAAIAEDTVGNDDKNDKDGDVPSLMAH